MNKRMAKLVIRASIYEPQKLAAAKADRKKWNPVSMAYVKGRNSNNGTDGWRFEFHADDGDYISIFFFATWPTIAAKDICNSIYNPMLFANKVLN